MVETQPATVIGLIQAAGRISRRLVETTQPKDKVSQCLLELMKE